MITTAYFGPESYPEQNTTVGDFVSRKIWGEPDCFEKYCTMAVLRDGDLIAGVVYHNWHPKDGVIELSTGGGDGWVARPVLRAMFALPFEILGARLVVWRVSEHNVKVRSMARRLGFQETVIPRLRGDNEAECVCTLHADDWANNRMSK